MAELWDAAILVVLLLGASAAGLWVQLFLSERHRTRETVELIQLVVTMLVTFAALVLGLLTTSVKASFDTIGNDIRGYATEIIQLNRLLREYGSAAQPVREHLRTYTAAAIASTWANQAKPGGDYDPKAVEQTPTDAMLESSGLGDMLRDIELEIRALPATDPVQQRLVSDCLTQFERLMERRWKLIEEAHGSISMPFYTVLVFWLIIVFASFGLCAPRNLLVSLIILMGALSIGSAVFVILELDTPFLGLVSVPSQPMRDALVHLSR